MKISGVHWDCTSNCSCAADEATATMLERLYQMLEELYINQRIKYETTLLLKDTLLQIWVPQADQETLLVEHSPYGLDYEEGSSSSQLKLYREVSCLIGVKKYAATYYPKFSDQANFLHYPVAKRFGIQASKLFPVFNLASPPLSSAIVVLELVTTKKDPDFAIEEYQEIKRELQKIGLTTSYSSRHYFLKELESSLAAQAGWVTSLMARNADQVSGVSSTDSNTDLLQETPTVSARLPIVGKITTPLYLGVKVDTDAAGFKLDDEANSHQQLVQEMKGWQRS